MLERARRRAVSAAFPLFQRLGVHVTPIHFYSPIPDTSRLSPALWDAPDAHVPGLDFRPDEQLRLLADFRKEYSEEYKRLYQQPLNSQGFTIHNKVFGPVDAELLYCMVRSLRPRRIIEVGGGQSSIVIDLALQANADQDPEHSCTFEVIDPFPPPILSRLRHLSALHKQRVEEMPLALFSELEAKDILFIDSSHVVRIGNDVHFEYLQLLPSLPRGVYVHIHDIFMPADYPRDWLVRYKRFWNEQYLLQAFLTFNSAYEIVAAAQYLHLFHSNELNRACPSYDPRVHVPGSFWLRRKPDGPL